MQRYNTHLHLAHLRFAPKKDTKDFDGVKRSSPLLRNRLHILLNIKMDLPKYITQMEVINLALLSETHNPQVVRPTSFHFISNGDLVPIADGDGEDLLGIGNSPLGHAPSSPVPEENLVSRRARGDWGAVQRAAQRRRVRGEVPVLQHKDILPVLKTWFIKSGTVGGVRVTVLCITSRSFSKMLSKNINV